MRILAQLFFQYSEHFVLLGKWITVHSQMQTNDVTKDSPILSGNPSSQSNFKYLRIIMRQKKKHSPRETLS